MSAVKTAPSDVDRAHSWLLRFSDDDAVLISSLALARNLAELLTEVRAEERLQASAAAQPAVDTQSIVSENYTQGRGPADAKDDRLAVAYSELDAIHRVLSGMVDVSAPDECTALDLAIVLRDRRRNEAQGDGVAPFVDLVAELLLDQKIGHDRGTAFERKPLCLCRWCRAHRAVPGDHRLVKQLASYKTGRPEAQPDEEMTLLRKIAEAADEWSLAKASPIGMWNLLQQWRRRESPRNETKGEQHASGDGHGHGAAVAGGAPLAGGSEGRSGGQQHPLEDVAGSDGRGTPEVPLRGGALGSGGGRDVPESVTAGPKASQAGETVTLGYVSPAYHVEVRDGLAAEVARLRKVLAGVDYYVEAWTDGDDPIHALGHIQKLVEEVDGAAPSVGAGSKEKA